MLSMSFHGGIMSMHRKKIFYLIPKTDSGTKAFQVAKLVHNGTQPLDMIMVGTWLNGKRKNIPEKEWILFVREFISDIDKLTPLCETEVEKEKLSKIKNVINEVASELKPGGDCSLELLNRAEVELGWTKKSKL